MAPDPPVAAAGPLLAWYPLALAEQVARGQRALADIAETAARLEVPAVVLPDALLAPLGAHSAPAVRQIFEASGVRVLAVLAAPDFSSPLLATRQKERFAAERMLDAATTLGAQTIRFTLGPAHPGIPVAAALDLALENLAELSALARPRGVVCCVENVLRDARWPAPDISAAPADVFERLMGRVENAGLSVIVNTGNPALVGADPVAVLAAVPENALFAVHLCEREPPRGQWRVPGESGGPVSWRRLKATLRGRGFAGPFVLVDGFAGGEADTRRSLA